MIRKPTRNFSTIRKPSQPFDDSEIVAPTAGGIRLIRYIRETKKGIRRIGVRRSYRNRHINM